MLRSSTRGVASLPTGSCARRDATAPPSAPSSSLSESRARGEGEGPLPSLPHGSGSTSHPLPPHVPPPSRALILPSRASSLPLRTRGGAFFAGGGEGDCDGEKPTLYCEGEPAPSLCAARPPESALLGGCGVLAGTRAALSRASSAALMVTGPPARRAKSSSRAWLG